MREKMRGHLSKGGEGKFDLKQDRGGIADIEFMVQYGVLGWACDYPALVVHTDNIRILDALAESGVIADDSATLLADAYRAYRARAHRLSLQEVPAVVDEREFAEMRERVTACWHELMESD